MYAKIFTSLWQGTLYGKRDAQLVFIYLLAHCGPDGHVRVIPERIAADTGIQFKAVIEALALLEAPDEHSGTEDDKGCRLMRIGSSWSWTVTNYAKYRGMRDERERRRQNLEAKRRERERRKPVVSSGKPPSAVVSHGQPLSSQAEAEAEAEANVKTPSSAKLMRELARQHDDKLWQCQFERLWGLWPRGRRIGKAPALRSWSKLSPPAGPDWPIHAALLADRIVAALEFDLRHTWAGRDVDKIPHCVTWLNQRRFDDPREQPGNGAVRREGERSRGPAGQPLIWWQGSWRTEQEAELFGWKAKEPRT